MSKTLVLTGNGGLETKVGKKKNIAEGDISIHRLRALPSGQLVKDKLKYIGKYEKIIHKHAHTLKRCGCNKTYDELVQIGVDALMRVGQDFKANAKKSTFIYDVLWYEMAGLEAGTPRTSFKKQICTTCKEDKDNPHEVICFYYDGLFHCPKCGATYPAPERYVQVSLDSYIGGDGDDEGLQLHEILANPDDTPEDDTEYSQLRALMEEVLTPMEYDVIIQTHWHGQTLQNIADQYGYTRERVRQYKERGHDKIREALRDKQINLSFIRKMEVRKMGKPQSQKVSPAQSGKKKQEDHEQKRLF